MWTRYFFRISYKGTNYSGWQVQPNAISVQGVLQDCLTKLNKNIPVKIMGCGRTDAGVHAQNFLMHTDLEAPIDVSHMIYKLNHMLPHDISVHAISEMPDKAHTRFDARKRTYVYYFHFEKDPFLEDRSLLIDKSMNIDKMKEGANLLLTYNDFEAFSRVRTEVNNFICDLSEAKFEMNHNQLVFSISANRFLRNMVRAIVGTLLEVGQEKITLEDFKAIINSKDRNKAGKSAPAKGLFLKKIEYPYKIP